MIKSFYTNRFYCKRCIQLIISTIDILDLIWFLFFVYWTASIIFESLTKKTKTIKKRESLTLIFLNRFFLYAAVILIFIIPYNFRSFPFDLNFSPNSIIISFLGLVIALTGILFAIWARFTLGNNWSGDIVLKKNQILITTGPYNIVRHPIYTGITLAVMGSVIAENSLIGLIAILSIIIFSYFRIKTEENLLKLEFGKEYEDYAMSVKTFIPWIW